AAVWPGRLAMELRAKRRETSMARGFARPGCWEMKRPNADRVEALAGQQHETHEIAERVGQCQDFGGHPAFRAADGLVLRPPFAPCPWRWTLTMVASTMTYSMSGSSETASNRRFQTPAFAQSRKRVYTVIQSPKARGRSRHGLPV